MMLIIGIDPGITGAICFFEDRKIIDLNLKKTDSGWPVLRVQYNSDLITKDKIETANFFFNRVLPRIGTHYKSATSGSSYIMDFKFN